MAKELAGLYEDVQEFTVVTSLTPAALTCAALTPAASAPAPADHPETETVIGCGALHVLWGDLGEVRTLAVDPAWQGRRIGSAILARLVERGRELGLSRLFALTFHTDFFGRHGFVEIDGAPVDAAGFEALRRSYDPGVAEFLGLEFVKPNTLGNTRMLLTLAP